MNALALASKSKMNKELAIMTGLGILFIGGMCYYYYTQNQELKYIHRKNTGQMSDLNSQISTLMENNNNFQSAYNELYIKHNYLLKSFQKLESNLSIEKNGSQS